MPVTLKEITRKNWYEAAKLAVDESQQDFVASNLYSIAQSKFYPTWVPLAIYNEDDTMVGFLMYGEETEENAGDFWIIRLMVDRRHQGQGYGQAAMDAVIKRIKQQPNLKAIYTSYAPENTAAAKLYAGLGFEETGAVEDGEIVVRLK